MKKENTPLKKIINEKTFAIALVIVFVISLIPILYLCKYEYATGDDLGYGKYTHHAWMAGHSISSLFLAVCNTVKLYYYSWQGTWFTIAIMSLQPEVFNPDLYWITPLIMLFITIGATTLMIRELCGRTIGMTPWKWISIDMLVLLAMIQYFPSTASAIYWFNGGAHYIVPYGIAAITVWSMLRYRTGRKIRYIVIAAITMTALGGASYLMPLFVLIILFYLLLVDCLLRKNPPMWWMLLPAALEIIGLIISYKSPGNKIRGGEEFAISAGAVAGTILKSFQQAFMGIGEYIKDYPLVIICIILIGIISFDYFTKTSNSPTIHSLEFGYPLLFILAMFAIYAAMYAPGIFAGVEVSGGVPNTIFQVYILTAVYSMVYLTGWLAGKLSKQGPDTEQISKENIKIEIIYCCILLACVILMVLFRGTIKEATSYEALTYLRSGSADDFKAQMEYNRSILLDESIKDCYLCPINDNQGPLMHMPVTDNPERFTNTVNAGFYNKNVVVADNDINIQAQ